MNILSGKDFTTDQLPQWLQAQTVDHPRFCDCISGNCRCEEDNDFEWEWDKDHAAPAVVLSEENLTVLFHNEFSQGTSAVRGTKLLEKGRHHYWEVKILTPPYGTDLMVGVGTSKVHMSSTKGVFCSFLGLDQESFGFSYQGYIQYGGKKKKYGCSFGQGSLVGVYLNMWKGTLEFFLNRKSLGIAFCGLRNTMLYPMVCSTAAKNDDDDDEGDDDLKFLTEYMILDDFDFALVGIGRKKKRKL